MTALLAVYITGLIAMSAWASMRVGPDGMKAFPLLLRVFIRATGALIVGVIWPLLFLIVAYRAVFKAA